MIFNARQNLLLVHLEKYINYEWPWNRNKFRGIYIHGGVGTGKTTIMNSFFDKCNLKSKKKIHFSDFIKEIEGLIQQSRSKNSNDVMKYVLKMYKKLKLLCIDEFEIHDITTSILARRVITFLIQNKCIIIITSNSIPDNLYKNGLQRAKFEEFISFLHSKLEIFELSSEDYRKSIFSNKQKVYIGDSMDILPDILRNIANNVEFKEFEIIANSRKTIVIKGGDILLFDFNVFCKKSYSHLDYKDVINISETIVVYNIPEPSFDTIDYWLRFCLLIDILYTSNKSCYFIINHDYITYDYSVFQDKIPQINRCISRLYEMKYR